MLVLYSSITAVVTVLVFADQASPSLFIPVVSLAILDNGLTLGSLYYASSGALSRDRQRKRSTGRIAGNEMQLRSDSMLHRSRVSSGGRAAQDSHLTSNNRGYTTTDSGQVAVTMQNTTAADDASSIQAAVPVQSSALTPPLEHSAPDAL
eukprot:7097-Heterococcus_DN1.PRE.1